MIRTSAWTFHDAMMLLIPGLTQSTRLIQFSSVQSLSRVRICNPMDASLSITNSQSPPKHMSIVSVMWSNHLILCHPLLLLPSIFSSIRVFSNESVLCIRWPRTGVSASASVLLMNIQDWLPLGLAGWISLQSKGLSGVFYNNTVKKHQFFSTQLYVPTLTSLHGYWKKHSFD